MTNEELLKAEIEMHKSRAFLLGDVGLSIGLNKTKEDMRILDQQFDFIAAKMNKIDKHLEK